MKAATAVVTGESVHAVDESFSAEEMIKKSFALDDKDNDGKITCEEMNQILLKQGVHEEQAAAMVFQMDEDNDNTVTFEEYEALMKRVAEESAKV